MTGAFIDDTPPSGNVCRDFGRPGADVRHNDALTVTQVMANLSRLDQQVDLSVSVRPRTAPAATREAPAAELVRRCMIRQSAAIG
jgi:hypothetical protein